MTTTRTYWIDLSNHQGAATPQQAANAWEQGYRGVVVNLYGPFALQQLATYRAAGFRTSAYIYLNFPGGPFWSGIPLRDQVTAFLAKAQHEALERIWLDCEDEGNTLSAAETVAELRACRAEVIAWGRAVGWYTAGFWWVPQTGDAHDFAGDELWLATNDGVDDLAFPKPFGGWERLQMEQYSITGYIDASLPEVDLNVMEEVQEQEDDVQVKALALSDAIEKVQRFVRNATDAIDPSDGDGMYEVTAGFPGAKPDKEYIVLEMDKGA